MDQNKKSFRTNESLFHSFLHSCLGKIIILAGIIAVLLLIAHITVPGREEMTEETEDNIRQCIMANDSLPTDKIDDFINNIGYTFTHADSTFDVEIWRTFNKYNRLEYHEHPFYSTMHIHNNFRPEGTRVSIGIFGLVIPTVNYNDFLLRVGPIHKGYDRVLIKNTYIEEEYFGENPGIKEYHYHGEKSE